MNSPDCASGLLSALCTHCVLPRVSMDTSFNFDHLISPPSVSISAISTCLHSFPLHYENIMSFITLNCLPLPSGSATFTASALRLVVHSGFMSFLPRLHRFFITIGTILSVILSLLFHDWEESFTLRVTAVSQFPVKTNISLLPETISLFWDLLSRTLLTQTCWSLSVSDRLFCTTIIYLKIPAGIKVLNCFLASSLDICCFSPSWIQPPSLLIKLSSRIRSCLSCFHDPTLRCLEFKTGASSLPLFSTWWQSWSTAGFSWPCWCLHAAVFMWDVSTYESGWRLLNAIFDLSARTFRVQLHPYGTLDEPPIKPGSF